MLSKRNNRKCIWYKVVVFSNFLSTNFLSTQRQRKLIKSFSLLVFYTIWFVKKKFQVHRNRHVFNNIGNINFSSETLISISNAIERPATGEWLIMLLCWLSVYLKKTIDLHDYFKVNRHTLPECKIKWNLFSSQEWPSGHWSFKKCTKIHCMGSERRYNKVVGDCPLKQ